jgi:hypothetical protein
LGKFFFVEEGDMDTQKKFLAFVIFLVFFLSAFVTDTSHARNKKDSPEKTPPNVTDTSPAKNKKKPPKHIPQVIISGKVSQILTSDDDPEFDYLLIRGQKGGKKWVAAPKKGFIKGDNVSCEEGIVLKGQRSKALKRQFDEIVFTECLKN